MKFFQFVAASPITASFKLPWNGFANTTANNCAKLGSQIMIELRRPAQYTLGDGLIDEQTSDLWEP